MTLKLAQFLNDPKTISTKSSYPKKIFVFQKTPKNIEIQNFEPQKMDRAYLCVKISEYPPPPPGVRRSNINLSNSNFDIICDNITNGRNKVNEGMII